MYYGKHTGKVDCPLFLRESNKEITCAIEKNYLSAKKFRSREEKEDYQEHHCCFGCIRCDGYLGTIKMS